MATNDVIYTIDGKDLKRMIFAALVWLQQHKEVINALNVFPVPDGDTGTNMTLTMTSAWQEIAELEDEQIGLMSSKVAHGALMGARGNSGVILSQIWRGFARGLDGKVQMQSRDLAVALRSAAETAYKGVVKPVEGTILTVIREVGDEAMRSADEIEDMELFFARLVQSAKAAVARTPSLLPVLKQAGVVDSGGQGLTVILEGMWRELKGLPVEGAEALASDAVALAHAHAGFGGLEDSADMLHFDSNYPYDVQFIVMGQGLDVAQMRETIEAMGDCALVVGDARTVKVHVHVPDPGVPISLGARYGSLRDVVVEDMQAQYQEFMAKKTSAPPVGVSFEAHAALLAPEEVPNIAIVVVSAGEGLNQVFRSLGATALIEGGQTMNPSTAQILEAIESTAAENVIILPNNKNIFMAAQQASEVSKCSVAVVPTRSIPQGVAALLVLDQSATLDGNVAAMLAAANEVITGEVTRATRDVELNGINVKTGHAIGLLDGQLVVDTGSYAEAVHWLLAEAELEDRELVTLYYGEGVTQAEAEALVAELTETYADLEFEVVLGGQPHYPYLLSIE